MKRIRLKYAITEFGETVYEVGLKVSCPQEEPAVKRPHKSIRKLSGASTATEAQIAQRRCFKSAVEYARAALAHPQLRLHYEEMARQQGKRPRGAAISDYLSGNDLLAKNNI